MNQTSQQPSLKEKQSHGTHLFPCAYLSFLQSQSPSSCRHHWHEEVEIVYLHHGSFKLDINMEPYGTDRECFLFINSGELHSLRSRVWNLMNRQLFSHHLCSFSRIMTRR